MSRSFFLSIVLLLVAGSRANAANFAVITAPPTILNILVLVFGVVCVGVSFHVYSAVRGGRLSRSWIFFLAAFALLVLTQLLSLFHTLEVISLPSFVIPACFTIMVGLFLKGVLEARKTFG